LAAGQGEQERCSADGVGSGAGATVQPSFVGPDGLNPEPSIPLMDTAVADAEMIDVPTLGIGVRGRLTL
jgi:hypothetical protein